MNRIDSAFSKIRSSGNNGFIPFVTACDPDLETSKQIVLKLAELGADIIELGVPFSDPMADGPVIQLSSDRALANGASLEMVLLLVTKLRHETEVPIVLFSYLNPLFRFGIQRFAEHAYDAGVDGVLITDVVDGEADEIRHLLKKHNIHLISLIAPTTSDERLVNICERASGFIYAISRRGITGGSVENTSEAQELVGRARRSTKLPLAVGFGISSNIQMKEVSDYADAVVVGSAIVAEIGKAKTDKVAAVESKVRELLGK